MYYMIATVHSVATAKSIRLWIYLLRQPTDIFSSTKSTPYASSMMALVNLIDEVFTYVAVAENKQFFTQIAPYMLPKCTQGLYTICSSDMILKSASEPKCLTALFLGKTDITLSKCRRLVLIGTFESV